MAEETSAVPAEPVAEAAPAAAEAAPAVEAPAPAEAAPAEVAPKERTSIFEEEGTPAEAPVVAPDAYTFEAPEGVEFDSTTIDSFSKLAKEDGLSQEAADRYVGLLQDHNKRAEAAQQAAHDEVLDGWEAAVKALPNYQSTVLLAKKAESFMNDAMKDLVKGPLGFNPDFIQYCAAVGAAHSEDSVVTSGVAQQTTPQSLGASLYPDMASN
jgi:hypothetical protein